jgi:hypothetical protein
MDETMLIKELWCRVYAAVVASERESVETAVMQANEAVTRYIVAWDIHNPWTTAARGGRPHE